MNKTCRHQPSNSTHKTREYTRKGTSRWRPVTTVHTPRLTYVRIHAQLVQSSHLASVSLELALGLLDVGDEVGNGADLDPPLARKGNAGLASQHADVLADGLTGNLLAVVNNLADGGGLCLAGQTAELNSGLGVAVALADASSAGLQREDVAGATQALGLGARIGEHAAHEGAVAGADASGDGRVSGVDGDGVGGAARVFVVGDHLGEAEGGDEGGRERRADVAGGVADEEAHLLGGHILSGDDEVGFVLAGGVIEDDEELAIS